ncbi:MAG: hypothetical protein ACM3YM_10655 [Sphingomonadales bacterium]
MGAIVWLADSAPALAQSEAQPAEGESAPAPAASTDADQPAADQAPADSSASDSGDGGTDIFSRNTLFVLLDGRIALANGERSWTNRGLGKTRFQGTHDGDYRVTAAPVEADLVWIPRFTRSLSANVSVAWQRDQENAVDLLEAFVNFLPERTGKVGFSARAGLMWPEISLEHSTGGAWTVVNTITPSTINAWVGEEVKLVGVEGTLHLSLGEHELSTTAGIFGFNDTSGTLLSFRGWALHDEKATAFGHFKLPPLNRFITNAQEHRTRSLIELDDRPGFYGRLDWRPPWPFGAALFYYDNRGDPEEFTRNLQWGWRTRFWNLGVNADLGSSTKLLAQGMTGSTIMGFRVNGVRWVHTRFRSAYALVTHQFDDRLAVTGRIEAFGTTERGSEMSRDESEHGWSTTVAARYTINTNLTALVEALNVRSRRGTRVNLGLSPFQAQTVFQASLRFKL